MRTREHVPGGSERAAGLAGNTDRLFSTVLRRTVVIASAAARDAKKAKKALKTNRKTKNSARNGTVFVSADIDRCCNRNDFAGLEASAGEQLV